MTYLTANQVAEKLKISRRRVLAKIKQGHFPNAIMCSCGVSWLIPDKDIKK